MVLYFTLRYDRHVGELIIQNEVNMENGMKKVSELTKKLALALSEC